MKNKELFVCEFHRSEFKISTFNEITAALISSLNQAFLPAFYVQNSCSSDGINLIFGAHRLFQSYERINNFPSSSVIFNLEPLFPLSKNDSHLRYLDFLKKSRVIDYSHKNINTLNEMGNNNTYLFKFGYTPFLSSNIGPPRNENYFFYGAVTERRKVIIDALIKKNIPIFGSNSCWGYERDYEILASKAILNISKSSDSILEVYRLWHSLCLGTSVITERGSDAKLAEDWSPYVTIVDNLIDVNAATLNNFISADAYKKNTSFNSEVSQMMNWINQSVN